MSQHVSKLLIFATLFLSQFCWAGDTFATREDRYHLHPGDVISVEYRYSPEYNATVTIQPDNYATFPLVGDLRIGGLTLSEAHSQFITKAGERLNEPELTLNLKEFEKPYYIVGGEVAQPGKFEIRGRVTALRAVEMAGGFRNSGQVSQVLLIRPINDVDAQTKLIDFKKVLNKIQLSDDVELRAGDLLIVPKTRLAKVEPIIRLLNPGFGFYLNPFNR